jgi:diguanylate cyclase (GGDEF)-like protein
MWLMKMGYKGRTIATILVVAEFCIWIMITYIDGPNQMSVHRIAIDLIVSMVQGTVYFWFGLQYDKVRFFADRDNFTGLFNRTYMMKVLSQGLHKASVQRQSFSVLIVDVNQLKWVNDSFGHLAGDELIRRVSIVLGTLTTHGGIAGRLGGDEFLVIYPLFERVTAETIVASIQYELNHISLDRARGHVPSVSVGIASYPEDGNTPHMLLKAADDRMYQHKAIHHAHFAP